MAVEAAFWTHCEADVPTACRRSRIFAGLGRPHTLLRIGYGYPTRLTSRRPIEDVLTHHTGPDVPAE